MQRIAVLLVASLALAGCSSSGGSTATGSFTLDIADSLAGGSLELKGAYLHTEAGWIEALPTGTRFAFEGLGGNVSQSGDVSAGTYDRVRLLFGAVELGGRAAVLSQSGIEVLVNVSIPSKGMTHLGLSFAWPDAFFESAQGLAFTPVLSRLVVVVDGAETLRLEASEIATSAGKAPVARMRVFDPTGLEVFASTFVADSPDARVVGNAGNLTFSATASEVLEPGTTLGTITWDIGGTVLTGNTVVWSSPIDGGNFTVRLTVADSDGNEDSQTLKMALKPGTATRTVHFTGSATGIGGTQGVQEHTFDVDTATVDNASALLSHVTLVMTPGSATIPISDLDVTLDDGAGKRLGSQTGSGSQHKIDVDTPEVSSGAWLVRVIPDPAYEADYSLDITLTWRGVNPGIEAFLAEYDDGHSHQH